MTLTLPGLLLVALAAAPAPRPLPGLTPAPAPHAAAYVMDSGLTPADCAAALAAAPHAPGLTWLCLPPCPTEDSDSCYWAAGVMGNGEGESFLSIGGQVYRLPD